LLGLVVILLLVTINKAGVQSLLPYLILGLFLWAAFIESGIHTSVAGVILALTIPVHPGRKGQEAPLTRLEHALAPWVNYLILPVFALSNAGIIFQGTSFSTVFLTQLVSGIFLGLLVGKPLGITAACLAVVFLRLAHLPKGVSWTHLAGAGLLGGIGFTTSIFLANLAFPGQALFEHSKIGILPASVGAAVAGWLLLTITSRAEPEKQPI
jgi:NhaA family Na+:H+ antiporter